MKYRKKPVIIEAFQWNGDNTDKVINAVIERGGGGKIGTDGDKIVIETLEGKMTASVGDYIIRGVNGEFYPCKPDIFDKTYEPVTSDEGMRY